VLKLPDAPREQVGMILFQIADGHRAGGDAKAAEDAYRTCLEQPGPHVPKARLELARLLLDKRDPQQPEKLDPAQIQPALALLEQNITAVPPPDKDAHETSLSVAADALFKRLRDYPGAESRILLLLQYYPTSRFVPVAKNILGHCYWWQASIANQKAGDDKLPAPEREAAQKAFLEFMTKAIEPFRELEAMLLQKQATGRLSADEATLLRQAGWRLAEGQFYLKNYAETVKLYMALADRHKGQVDELLALSQVRHCLIRCVVPPQPEEAQKVLARMREAFAAMPAEAFRDSSQEYTKAFWEKWFQDVDKPTGTAAAGQ
jgi:hypothetical protein